MRGMGGVWGVRIGGYPAEGGAGPGERAEVGVTGGGKRMRSQSDQLCWPISDRRQLGGAAGYHPFKEVTAAGARSN